MFIFFLRRWRKRVCRSEVHTALIWFPCRPSGLHGHMRVEQIGISFQMLMAMWPFLCRGNNRLIACWAYLCINPGQAAYQGVLCASVTHTFWQAGVRSTLISCWWASREPDMPAILWAVPEATPSGHSVNLFIVKLVENSAGLYWRVPPQSSTSTLFNLEHMHDFNTRRGHTFMNATVDLDLRSGGRLEPGLGRTGRGDNS